MQIFTERLTSSFRLLTINPAGTQINNDLFLCALSVIFLHVFCLSKITNITLCC